MIDKVISILFGTKHERDIKKLKPLVERINALEPEIKELSNDGLRQKTTELRERARKGESLDSILPEAFALVREASVRTLGMRHFDVQLMGGIVLHQGKIAEMKTGEGKTLVATLPVFLNALSGEGAHVVTVNDYLARRDSRWMGTIYEFLGLTVGVILHDMDPYQRQKAYACDITYGTNNEFGFDYLRDNMVEHRSLRVQRSRNFCIVDEVDSILIDEARTPLIISGSTEESTKKYFLINKIIPSLQDGADYEVNEKDRHVSLTEDGVKHVERLLKIENLYDSKNIEIIHHVNQALKAHALFHRDIDYTVKDGEVLIVDEFTGRLMPGRRFSDGLHQALEAKENVTIARESQTLASVTFQNFFRMYSKLSGMTGTADTEAVEFRKIYGLDVVVVPTNKSMIRKDQPDRIYRTAKEKFNSIVDEIEELNAKEQPILVGTISIENSEKLSMMLKNRGIIHNVLNAKYHEKEAQIVAEAGKPGGVTIATNMAGRGTDIVLGGKREYMDELENHEAVHDKNLWNDFKLAVLTEHFDRADELSETMTGQDKHKAKNIIRTGREWVVNHEKVVTAGGLHILGTERHEARRIDNQLRGRSGRQGDPGSSRFYLSLEDDLMRLFASERISNIMQRLGMEEGQEIESPMVTKAIANAQKRVEGRNFEIRKHLLEYDDVMNSQRAFIYTERDEILEGEDISDKIMTYIRDVAENSLDALTGGGGHPEEWDLEGIKIWMKTKFLIDLDYEKVDPYDMPYREFVQSVGEFIEQNYRDKENVMGSGDMRTLERLISLQVIDNKWREHLLNMDQLRDGIWTMGYGEKNPLVEYKIEGFHMFNKMLLAMKEEIIEYMMKVQIQRVLEDINDRDYRAVGQEFHPEVEQFGSGGIPGALKVPVKKKEDKQPPQETVGGVKRKKTRRSKRR
ncbi:MAG: preprotein translocase subunit SecA [Spirochaetae bacterium HGW-Spirochaetae-1]|jgi:preprotein translocase subunit SecA|nr:MAG: preprotein translocase subunit SecA [Spirochaetae bacterium HGW-Spirochaetae-1]